MLRYLQVAAIGALLLIAAVLYTFTHVTRPETPQSFQPVPVSPPYRQKVPHFEWSNGDVHLRSEDLKGSWTLLSFWSYTCAPCLTELPDLDGMNEDWSGPELTVLTVNVDPNSTELAETTKQFLADSEIQLPVYADSDGKLKKIFGVQEIPHHFLISPSGDVIWQSKGAFNWTSPETERSLLTMMAREKPPEPPESPEEP